MKITRWTVTRYLLLTAWATAWAVPLWNQGANRVSDYDVMTAGGRALFGTLPTYHDGAMHVYAQMPFLQVGPPVVVLSGALAPLRFVGQGIWGALIVLCGLVAVAAVERTLLNLGQSPRRAAVSSFAAGLLVMACWSTYQQAFHLEDAWTVAALALTVAAISGRRSWWLPAVLLGSAVAVKPWAVVFLPLLLTYPRRDALRGIGAAAALGVLSWVPFVVADPHTITSVGSLNSRVFPMSSLYALGLRGVVSGDVRSLAMVVGFLLCALMVMRGRWLAAPMVAMAGRLLLEPRHYFYYGLGPVVAALMWDLSRQRRVPWWTLGAVAAHFGVSLTGSVFGADLSTAEGVAQLVFDAAVVVAFVLVPRTADAPEVAAVQAPVPA